MTAAHDPIFKAICKHRCEVARLNALSEKQLENCDFNAERKAAWNVVTTTPTTMAGIRALLSYMRELIDRCDDADGFLDTDFFAALNFSVEKAVCQLSGCPKPRTPRVLREAEAA